MTDKTSPNVSPADLDNTRRNALVDEYNAASGQSEAPRVPRSHAESVLLRLTVIAWFVGILAVLAFVAFIVGTFLFSSEMNDLVSVIRDHP